MIKISSYNCECFGILSLIEYCCISLRDDVNSDNNSRHGHIVRMHAHCEQLDVWTTTVFLYTCLGLNHLSVTYSARPPRSLLHTTAYSVSDNHNSFMVKNRHTVVWDKPMSP